MPKGTMDVGDGWVGGGVGRGHYGCFQVLQLSVAGVEIKLNQINKLASLQDVLIRNYNSPTHLITHMGKI